MAKRALVRGGVAVLTALGLAIPLGAMSTPAAAADVPAGGGLTSFASAAPWKPAANTEYAGTSGFVRHTVDRKHWYWTRYADGSSVEIPAMPDAWLRQNRVSTTGSDILRLADIHHQFRDQPAGHAYRHSLGDPHPERRASRRDGGQHGCDLLR